MNRDAFLDRIAERLGRARQTTAPTRDVHGVPEFYREAPYGADAGLVDRVARFQTELEALGGHLRVANSTAEAGTLLRALLDELAPRTILTWDRSEFRGWDVDWLWSEREAVAFSPNGPLPADAVQSAARIADVGITLVDFAIANTGTLALVTTPQRARSVSLLPTTHIALVHESQFVDRMGDALPTFSRWSAAEQPSSVHFISGPSRSADIENDLSIGVHGPAALYVIAARGE